MLARRLERWSARSSQRRCDAKSKPCEKRSAVWSAPGRRDDGEMGGGIEGQDWTLGGRVDRVCQRGRTQGREGAARVVKDETQNGHQQCLVDCGTCGRKEWGGRYTGRVPGGRCPLCRGAICGAKGKAAGHL